VTVEAGGASRLNRHLDLDMAVTPRRKPNCDLTRPVDRGGPGGETHERQEAIVERRGWRARIGHHGGRARPNLKFTGLTQNLGQQGANTPTLRLLF
jgi:hypothetical protein